MIKTDEMNPANEALFTTKNSTGRLLFVSSRLSYNNKDKQQKKSLYNKQIQRKQIYKIHKDKISIITKKRENKLKSLPTWIIKQKPILIVIIAIVILLSWILGVFSACSVMGTIAFDRIIQSTYLSDIESIEYDISNEYRNDDTFNSIITEAEKYIGYPYVWGGSTPETSFDCSGYVCWVYNTSGVIEIERTTTQGLYNKCQKIDYTEAKPGNLVFFTGTYETDKDVTHVGIYVGDGIMLHCGNPIGYTSIDNKYWQEHFYGFGDLLNKE